MHFQTAFHRRPLMSRVVISFFFSSFSRGWCESQQPARCPGSPGTLPCPAGRGPAGLFCSLGWWLRHRLAGVLNFGCPCVPSLWWKIKCLEVSNIGVVSVLGIYRRSLVYGCNIVSLPLLMWPSWVTRSQALQPWESRGWWNTVFFLPLVRKGCLQRGFARYLAVLCRQRILLSIHTRTNPAFLKVTSVSVSS